MKHIGVILHGFHSLYDAWRDKSLGIETRLHSPEIYKNGSLLIQFKRTLQSKHGDHNEYGPVDWFSLPKLLRHLPIDGEAEFLDLGCGLGRALLIAGDFPFKKIWGLELDPRLVNICRKNINTVLRSRNQRLATDFPADKPIIGNEKPRFEILLGDASDFVIPDSVSHIFLANPFGESTLNSVVNSITDSYRRKRRRIFVIYRAPIYYEVLKNRFGFKEIAIGNLRLRRKFKIFRIGE